MRNRVRRILVAAMLCASGGAIAGDGSTDPLIVEFHRRDDPETLVRGWLTDYREENFDFERFGARKAVPVGWNELVEQDAQALRKRLGMDRSKAEAAGLVSGERIHFHGGGTAEGVLEKVDSRGTHWLRQNGILLPYPLDRIKEVEEIELPEVAVYDREQLYLRRIRTLSPRNALQHQQLADSLLAVGDFEDAKAHYLAAIEEEPSLKWQLKGKLEEIERSLANREAREALRKARRLYALDRRFDEAKALLQRLMDEQPDVRRTALRLIHEIDRERLEDLRKRYHAAKEEEVREAVRAYLLRKHPSLREAMSWAESGLQADVRERLAARLDLNEEEREHLEKTQATHAPHWASYWSGSFVISKRAQIGRSTPRKRRGDPEAWWAAYPGVAARSSFLRAYAAERLPDLFEVVQVKFHDCERCGGRGSVERGSWKSTPSAGMNWKELCPRCYGACRDRVVGYR